MVRKEHYVTYTDKELQSIQTVGESQSNQAKAAAMTKAEIEAAIADDPDEADMLVDLSKAYIELPQPKAILNMRVDADVQAYFRS